jgi:hypothetical protein
MSLFEPISMIKKPIILCSDAMNYVLFLVCDRVIHTASKSDSGSQVGEYMRPPLACSC